MSRRAFWGLGLLVALMIAAVASYYASGSPDGLEYVAERTGFADTAEDSAAAGSPLADYGVRGVENDRLSIGLAGLAGCLLVLAVTTVLTRLVRRRNP